MLKNMKWLLTVAIILAGISASYDVYAATTQILLPDSNSVTGTVLAENENISTGYYYASIPFNVEEDGYYAFWETSGKQCEWMFSDKEDWYQSYETFMGQAESTAHYFKKGQYFLRVYGDIGEQMSVAMSKVEYSIEIVDESKTTYTSNTLEIDVSDIMEEWRANVRIKVLQNGTELFTEELEKYSIDKYINYRCGYEMKLFDNGKVIDDYYIPEGKYQICVTDIVEDDNDGMFEPIIISEITVEAREQVSSGSIPIGTRVNLRAGEMYAINVSEPTYLVDTAIDEDQLYTCLNTNGNLWEAEEKMLYVPQAGNVYIEAYEDTVVEFHLADIEIIKKKELVPTFYKEFDNRYNIIEKILNCYSCNVVLDNGDKWDEEWDYINYELYIDGEIADKKELENVGDYYLEIKLESGKEIFADDVQMKEVQQSSFFQITEEGTLTIPAKQRIAFEIEVEETGKFAVRLPELRSWNINICNASADDCKGGTYNCEVFLMKLERGTHYMVLENASAQDINADIIKWQELEIYSDVDPTIHCINSFLTEWARDIIDVQLESDSTKYIIKTSKGNYSYMWKQMDFLEFYAETFRDSRGEIVYSDYIYPGNSYTTTCYWKDEEAIFSYGFNVDSDIPLTNIVLDTVYKDKMYKALPKYYVYVPTTDQQLEVSLKASVGPTICCYQFVNNTYKKLNYTNYIGCSEDIKEYYDLKAGCKYIFTAYDIEPEEDEKWEWCFRIDHEESVANQNPTTEQQPVIDETSQLPTVGTSKTISKNKYKVTKSTNTVKEVAFVKPQSNKRSSITIPATVKISGQTYKVTEVSAKAFKNNKKLKTITIGKNVKKVGKEALSGCKKLKIITIKSTVLKSVGKNALKNIYKKATIKCPKKQFAKYKKLLKSKTGYKKTMKIKK